MLMLFSFKAALFGKLCWCMLHRFGIGIVS